jgi:hypothetical protein
MSNITVTKLQVPNGPRAHMRIVKTFRSATIAELSNGRDWYRRARRLAEDLVVEYALAIPGSPRWHKEVTKAAAVIAVLSPRLSWTKNVELARQVYTDAARIARLRNEPELYRQRRANLTESFPGLKGNGDKAYRILVDGEDPEDVVSGPKVTAFWRTIVDPTDPRAVVVDRHALDVAMGTVLDDRQRGIILGRKGAYEELSALYRRAAKLLSKDFHAGELSGWTPAEVQAVTWVVWRRNHAANKGAAQREEL